MKEGLTAANIKEAMDKMAEQTTKSSQIPDYMWITKQEIRRILGGKPAKDHIQAILNNPQIFETQLIGIPAYLLHKNEVEE